MSFVTNAQFLFCGNDRIAAITGPWSIIAWKTLRVYHNPLEKTLSFPHFTQNYLLYKNREL